MSDASYVTDKEGKECEGKTDEEAKTGEQGDGPTSSAVKPVIMKTTPAPAPPPFTNLLILPPLQSSEKGTPLLNGSIAKGAVVELPALRPEEPVANLRAAIGELLQFASLTQYRLELETGIVLPKDTQFAMSDDDDAAVTEKNHQSTSLESATFLSVQYTGKDAVIRKPDLIQEATKDCGSTSEPCSTHPRYLDDYGDLSSLTDTLMEQLNNPPKDPEQKNFSAFRIVLHSYDVAGVQDHVAKVNMLLEGNIPIVDRLVDSDDPAEKTETGEEKDEGGDKETDEDKTTQKIKIKSQTSRLPNLSEIPSIDMKEEQTLNHFFDLACGEYDSFATTTKNGNDPSKTSTSPKSKKPKSKETNGSRSSSPPRPNDAEDSSPPSMKEYLQKMETLDAQCKRGYVVKYSRFHPPVPYRRLLGDLAYLEVMVAPGSAAKETNGSNTTSVINITACASGFYVNKTNGKKFNPSRSEEPHFSHSLLDCLALASKSFRTAWVGALAAAKERSNFTAKLQLLDSPLQSLHRLARRSMLHPPTAVVGNSLNGSSNGSSNNVAIDSVVAKPLWIVPYDAKHAVVRSSETCDYHEQKSFHEEEYRHVYGLDWRSGSPRDWNEELQVAKEMPRDTIAERVDRARMIHKVLSDFGEAALLGAKGIFDGGIMPMNPNEHPRSHVYLHNNIFFSRALDSGLDTFKVVSGDNTSKKSVSRDAGCSGALHSLDNEGLHSLATVLVDYMGTRLVCQSIVPGILHGDKSHSVLYGTVDADSYLHTDEDMHKLLEDTLGEAFMIATRSLPVFPLSNERMEAIASWKKNNLPTLQQPLSEEDKAKKEEKYALKKDDVAMYCGPMELKGIGGSDKRKYLLDLTRLTPRDANWVPESMGGTGKFEGLMTSNGSDNKSTTKAAKKFIPSTLDDDEWTMAVLRRELVASLTHKKMLEWKKEREEAKSENEKEDESPATSPSAEDAGETKVSDDAESAATKKPVDHATNNKAVSSEALDKEGKEYLKSLRYNVNVFLPNLKPLESKDVCEQVKDDEQRARDAAVYLWDTLLPTLTTEIREGSNQIPCDGSALADMLHARGINCRYLGRLAQLAQKEEEIDRSGNKGSVEGADDSTTKKSVAGMNRYKMPSCWLEQLECEMVARASKHVLDSYFLKFGATAVSNASTLVASFLSSLLSTEEASAAECDAGLSCPPPTFLTASSPEEQEEFEFDTTVGGVYGDSDPVLPSRGEVWDDIANEVGRRFRYVLTLYNNNNSKKEASRALYLPLMRRVCQRNGIRLLARSYDLGNKCISSGGLRGIVPTYPISTFDILDICPVVKHSAAQNSGFNPCSFTNTNSICLNLQLTDAKQSLEVAHVLWNSRQFAKALDFAQEALALYQRVIETPLHPSVYRCLELMSAILLHLEEFEMAASNASRALAIAVQLGGFDCAEALSSNSTLGFIFSSCGDYANAFKHFQASVYIMKLCAGPRYSELPSMYFKIGGLYAEMGIESGLGEVALKFYRLAEQSKSSDGMFEALIARNSAMIMAVLEQHKDAVEFERKAYSIYCTIVGADHQMSKVSGRYLAHYMKLAIEQGKKDNVESKKREEELKADAMANIIEAELNEEERKQKKKNSKKKNNKQQIKAKGK